MTEEQVRARAVLDDLLDCDEGLRNKEISFIEDMDSKRYLNWTKKQIDWLDRIYKRVC